jgi:hypothetical protein
MKRTSMTTAILAGIAGVAGISNMANAIYLNSDGLGSVLIYPYYTVNGGNATLLSVVNTTSEGKAVKVRFLEAYNSREVLDFNLYMSPFDVWVGEVAAQAGGAAIFTQDNSCTVPAIPATGAPFRTFAFDGTVAPADGGPTSVARTREGYVEMIEMATVQSPTLDYITHDSTGVPPHCDRVVAAWNGGGYWQSNPQTDMSSPDGGLFGSGSVIDVDTGTIAGYNAEAIDSFYAAGTLPQHTEPKSLSPSLKSATDPTSYVFANGALVTTTYATGIDAVSSLFMVDSIYNEYVVDPLVGASTEWVVTFPTKRFYVDKYSNGGSSTAYKPFDVIFDKTSGGTSCSPIGLRFWNREEATTTTGNDFSPAPTAAGTALCYEAQVITFNEPTGPSKVLASTLKANIDLTGVGFTSGWALLDFTVDSSGAAVSNHQLPTAATLAGGSNNSSGIGNNNVFLGLPATGFEVAEFINGNVGGALANYTGLYRHKFHRSCLTACS